MFINFVKSITTSFVVSTILFLLFEYTLMYLTSKVSSSDLSILSSLSLLTFYILVVWPVVQISLFKYFCSRFRYWFRPNLVFYLLAVPGFGICYWLAVFYATQLLKTKEINSNNLTESVVFFVTFFLMYSAFTYVITINSVDHQPNPGRVKQKRGR